MSVSVIIPTHNRAPTLARALTSVFNQTQPAQEVLVVDDGSTDDTQALVKSSFPECRYLYQNNQGVSRARNLGIETARHEWLAFLDSDDEWLPDKLAAQMQALMDYPEQRICHTQEIWIRNGVRVNAMKKHTKSGGYIFGRCLPMCVISPSSVVVHRSLFDEIGLFDEDLPACEDYDLWLRICALHPVLFLDQPYIIKYGGHPDQLSQRFWGMDRFRIQALEKLIGSAQLSDGNRAMVLDTLIRKTGIFAQGAAKRGRQEAAGRYRHKQASYQNLRNQLESIT